AAVAQGTSETSSEGGAPAAPPAGAGAEPAQPATTPPSRPAAPVTPRAGGLGKAVIAPPPTTAKERAELLGRPLSELRPSRPDPRTASAGAVPRRGTAARPSPGQRPGSRKKKGGRRAQEAAAAEARQAAAHRVEVPETPVGEVKISDGITIKDLADRMDRKAKDIITRLFMEKQIMATINLALDEETAAWVVEAFGGTPHRVTMEEEAVGEAAIDSGENLPDYAEGEGVPRPPVVTMMGHVDHGKTSLLDAIRSTRVAEREAGGITQHIGAYKITQRHEGKEREIVFLDTPGHAAFTMMRARGAKVTDVVILVVAADDGVMPQTIEAIHHAKAAEVPIIVAVNKIDKPGANPDRVLQQLIEHDVLVEAFGGETVTVNVSAKTGEGIDQLLEMILLVSEVLELQADPKRPATGTVLEAKLDKSRGPIATVLVQNGTLKVGDVFIVGSGMGRVRALVDEHDRRLKQAGPATPVVVMGLDDVPQAGDLFQVFPDEQKARQISVYRRQKTKEEEQARRTALPTLDKLHEMIQQGEVNELPLVIKADVQGSVEVLSAALEKLSTSEVKVRVIHSGTGAITENDILLASASRAIIIGFNVRPERGVPETAQRVGVDIRLHTVIYKVAEEIEQAMLATLSPVEKEVYLGRVEVRETFRVPKLGVIAGCYVVDGLVRRDAQIRLLRDNVVIHEGKIGSLKRFKDDAKEVRAGFECGISIERYQDIKPGDEIEAFVIESVKRESLNA
ncbi:MAG TPA: translation initiation factor IF-2, partial [Acidobacteria bacterium]|nr:translation initiation factor IF-2 [Acidobacteriota bacterium]